MSSSSLEKSVESLNEDISSYQIKLDQVERGLELEPENTELTKLKSDLQHLISLTQSLADNQNAFTRNTTSAAAMATASSNGMRIPYTIGEAVEVLSGERPFAAVVKDILPDGAIKIWYFEFNTEVILPVSDLGKIARPTVKPTELTTFPFKCQCRYMQDSRWYDAIVTGKGENGYMITYTQYGQSEEIPISYVRKVDLHNVLLLFMHSLFFFKLLFILVV